MFTEEFTSGLLLSLYPKIPEGTLGQNSYVDKHAIKIMMFGKPFTFDFIFFDGTSRNRFHNLWNNMDIIILFFPALSSSFATAMAEIPDGFPVNSFKDLIRGNYG